MEERTTNQEATMRTELRIKEIGSYRVVCDVKLPRKRTLKYLDIQAVTASEAITKFAEIIEDHEGVWLDYTDFHVSKVWRETTYLTEEESSDSKARTDKFKAQIAARRAERSKR